MHAVETPKTGEPIAIIGSGCRFPGNASSPSKLWSLLSKPHDVLCEIPASRFNPHGFYHPDGEYHGHSNVKHSYLLSEDHRVFDADFFNIAANEANAIDPQQRLLMETVYEALENGGVRIHDLKGSDTAVYVGLMCEEYGGLQMRDLNVLPTYLATGTARSVVSNRISYFFDWRGPCMTIDTACSSSLVAVHQAVQTLRSGVSRVALAAGTNLILGPEAYITESTFHMLSPQGRSHMWDSRADGYGRGEGVAAVVLKRLSDAVADGDTIDCIIRETGVNQDGRTKGITVPSADAQVALIEETYRRAGLDLGTPQGRPQFFEAHGTGTPAGDPVEAEAIYRAIASKIQPTETGTETGTERLLVGSIKSVVGHTEGTAGLAGLIKISLALRHKVVPPNMLFQHLAAAIEPFYHNVEVPVSALEWPRLPSGQPLRASLNSFGFGGTNAHAIVESYEDQSSQTEMKESPVPASRENQSLLILPFTFSAVSKSSLKRSMHEFVDFLKQGDEAVRLNDLAYTLNSCRSMFPYRAAVSLGAGGKKDLIERIEDSISKPDWDTTSVFRLSSSTPLPTAKILGVFTGQGAQWAGMSRELIESSVFVQERLKYLDTVLASLPENDRPAWSLQHEILAEDALSKLGTATLSQPVCTALQIIQVDILSAAAIQFDAVVGHSSGEIAAAYACGVISDRDAIIIAYYRGLHSALSRRTGENGESGAMMAVGTSLDDLEELISLPEIQGRITIAAHNSPTSFTLSGDASAIEEARLALEDEGKFARVLKVDMAYHSHHMLGCADQYVESLKNARITVNKARAGCKWFSSVHDGAVVSGDEGLDALYWSQNMTQPVLFSSAVKAAYTNSEDGSLVSYNTIVELGPHAALKGPVKDSMTAIGASSPPYASILTRKQNALECLGEALGTVWKSNPAGSVDFKRLFNDVVHQGVGADNEATNLKIVKDMPSYSWDHDRVFWSESRRSKTLRTRSKPGHPLLGTLSPDSTTLDLVWTNVLRVSELPWLAGHQLQGQTVFPAAGYVALAIEAGMSFAGDSDVELIELQDVTIAKAITFEDERTGVETLFSLHIDQDTRDQQQVQSQQRNPTVMASFRFYTGSSSRDVDSISVVATGTVKLVLSSSSSSGTSQGAAPRSTVLPRQGPEPPKLALVDENEFYSELRKIGYQYSGSFQALTSIKRKLGASRGFVRLPKTEELHVSEENLLVHPGFLDAAFQSIFLAYCWPGDGSLWSLHVPTSIHRLRVDPKACQATSAATDPDQSPRLAFDATVRVFDRAVSKVTISGDVNIYSGPTPSTGGDNHGLIQVQGLGVVPFGAASVVQDTDVFYDNVYDVLDPDGELAMAGNRASEDEITRARLLERISYFYLRRLVMEITPEQEAKTEWHHQKLMAFARHVLEEMEDGNWKYADQEWNNDTVESMNDMMAVYEHEMVEIRLMRAVGENMAPSVRGETHMLQHMMKDGMLNQFYVEGLGLQPFTAFLAEMVAQITHRYPNMRVVEVGAGTGGATKSILRRIKGSFKDYTFTDISSGFFETAQGVFSAPDFQVNGRMHFQMLDAEKDVVNQGFKEQSYDLAVASLVLHATHDLRNTLNNVRKLLKPGGYLVMLEVTSNDIIRTSFTMGGLPGWWLGAENGRPWSPCVTAAEWHELLLQSGFSGVEASTPELDILPRPFGVLVSRATSDRMNLLMEPSAAADDVLPLCRIKDLLVVTGTSLKTTRLAHSAIKMLRRHCSSIVSVKTLDELVAAELSPQTSILSLGELDQPVFRNIDPQTFAGLKRVFTMAQNVIWATRGARCDEPYANITVGLGRSVKMEMPHIRMQIIDFDTNIEPEAQTLVDELLRLQILGQLESLDRNISGGGGGGGGDQGAGELQQLVWTQESEVMVTSAGKRIIPRIKPNLRWNSHYNSNRRDIVEDVNPAEVAVEIIERAKSGRENIATSYLLAREAASLDSLDLDSARDEDSVVEVVVSYATWDAAPVSSSLALYLVIGMNKRNGQQVVAVTDKVCSIVSVQEQLVFPYPLPDSEHVSPASFLHAAWAHITSRAILSGSQHQTRTLVISPSVAFARITRDMSCNAVGDVAFFTGLEEMAGPEVAFVHPLESESSIRQHVTANNDVSEIVTFGGNNDGLVDRILQCLDKPHLKITDTHAFQVRGNVPDKDHSLLSLVHQVLMESVNSAVEYTKSPDGQDSVATLSPEHIASLSSPPKGIIIDWTADTSIPIPMLQSDSTPLCRPDGTYMLFGLGGAGGLGSSLAEWMISQGARHIILTSRNPKADPAWIAKYAAQGVRVEMISNDITDKHSVQELVAQVRRSWPPIVGVANGAMVLHDTALEAMTYDQMMRVLRPKVDGTRFLDDLFRNDKRLEFFVLFSSLSSVFGNSGQSNYAASNMYEIAVCAQRRERGVVASVIDIGAIMGIGYMAREVGQNVLGQLVENGYRKLSERDFHLAFANAILAGRVGSDQPEELIMGLSSVAQSDQHKLAWTDNPRFSHVIQASSSRDGGNNGLGGSEATVSPRELLKLAESTDQVHKIIQDSVVDKLAIMLQLRSDADTTDDTLAAAARGKHDADALLEQTADDLGVDSLVAVELRSWFLKELEVSIPVLKILGGGTMNELVGYAVESLPMELVPNVSEQGDSPQPPLSSAASATAPSVAQSIFTTDTRKADGLSDGDSTEPSENPDPALSMPDLSGEEVKVSTPTSSDGYSQGADGNATEKTGTQLHIDKIVPMSFGQSRFWFMNHVVSDPSTFNVTASFRINGAIDVPNLKLAVRALGRRHEALRTCFFVDEDSQPKQGVLKESLLHLETRSIAAASPTPSPDQQEPGFDSEFDGLATHTFDLSKGETMRVMLLTQSRSQHHLIVAYHHINMDGASLGVLMADLQRLYIGATLKPPALQYTAFSEQQRRHLRNDTWKDELAFWKREFKSLPDVLPVFSLSPDKASSRQRIVMKGYKHIQHETRIPNQLGSRIRSLCRKIGVNPFHLYTALFQILLARLGARDHDICIGVADANRSEPGAMEAMGNFLNLFPVRLSTSTATLDTAFSSIAKETRKKIMESMAHSAVPLDAVLEEIKAPRSATHSPLFQAFIDYRVVAEKAYLGNAEIEGEKYAISATPYDIMLDIVDNYAGNASISFLVQEGLYDQRSAEVMSMCFLNLMKAFVEVPETTACAPQMYDQVEVDRALSIGCGPESDLPDTSILEDITSVVSANPDSLALRDENGISLSYRQMSLRAYSVAQALTALGCKMGSRIAILQEPTVDWICSLIGIWRIGATFVPLELDQGVERLKTIVKHADLAAILVHDDTVATFRDIVSGDDNILNKKLVNLSSLTTSTVVFAGEHGTSAMTGDSEAMILYTSGSTGIPKGISLPHRMVRATITGYTQTWAFGPQTVLQQTALSFDHSWQEALLGLATGGSVVVTPRMTRKDPVALTNIIVDREVTMATTVPSQSSAWLQHGNIDRLRGSKLTWLLSGGEAMSFPVIQLFQNLNKPDLRLLNIYGPTEVMVPTMHEVCYRDLTAADMPLPIGAVRPNYTAYVADEQTHHPVPAGVPGQLVVGGAGVATGYINDPALTAERFPLDQCASRHSLAHGWTRAHLTGDRVYLRESDGVFVLLGRIANDFQVKIRGQRLDVREVEASIVSTSNGQISGAVVHLRTMSSSTPLSSSSSSADGKGNDVIGSDFLVAHVALTPALAAESDLSDSNKKYDGMDEFLKDLVTRLPLPPYMRPSVVVPLTSLPVNNHGKVDRLAVTKLPLPSSPSQLNGDGVSQQDVDLTQNQQIVKDIWVSVLGSVAHAHTITPASDFFLVGGNSLLLISVRDKLKKIYHRQIALVELFQSTTLAEMADLLGDGNAEAPASDATAAAKRREHDWATETRYDDHGLSVLPSKGQVARENNKEGLVVVLTGATGFLGRRLIRAMIESPVIKTIYCIAVRDPSKLSDLSSANKVVIHAGDLRSPLLGLNSNDAQSIFTSADIIVHNGADVSFLKPYTTLKTTNVASTKELVRLIHTYPSASTSTSGPALHFVSTAGVAALTNNQQDLYERRLLGQPVGSSNTSGYVASKWACETFLENVAAADTGLRIVVHRPTAIVGPDAPRLDVMHNVINLAEQLRCVPQMRALQGWFQFVPIEEITRDMLDDILGDRPGGYAAVPDDALGPRIRYHNHCGPEEETVEIHDLGEYLGKKQGAQFKTVEDHEWVRRANAIGAAAEITEYLLTIGDNFEKTGAKWIFPRVWNRPDALKSD